MSPPSTGDLPHSLTFFLTRRERAAVLRTLRRHGTDRSPSLLRALRIENA
ncbi:MAG: hypothetical protein AAGI30_02245 [Planctomycetota bacterium]